MSGHIRRRGEQSWELKYEAGTDPRTGRRITKYCSFRGSKREAQAKLAALITAVATDTHVEPTKVTVAEFVRQRVDQWESSGKISARTAARYRELTENQIAPHIGAKVLQKLRPLDIEDWHTVLRNSGRADGKGGIHPRTIGHAHRVLSKALTDAVKNRLVMSSVTKLERAPKVAEAEMVIVKDMPAFLDKLKESARLYVPAMLSLFTGMRRGEVLALRWSRVDLDKKIIQVREALKKPMRTAFASSRQRATLAGATSPCPISWSRY
jgi:integrase